MSVNIARDFASALAESGGMKARTRHEPAELGRTSKGIMTRVNAEGLKALRMLALERDTTLQAICIEAL